VPNLRLPCFPCLVNKNCIVNFSHQHANILISGVGKIRQINVDDVQGHHDLANTHVGHTTLFECGRRPNRR
jgi:hypothetical protein